MKRGRPIRKVPTELDILQFPVSSEHTLGSHCLNCSSTLALSQPDLTLPERLLGVCEQCKSWFLIDLVPDQSAGLLLRLPDTEVIRQLTVEYLPEGDSKKSTKPQT